MNPVTAAEFSELDTEELGISEGVALAVHTTIEELEKDAIPEGVAFLLWEKVTDSLMRLGYFERDGAKLISAGLVPGIQATE